MLSGGDLSRCPPSLPNCLPSLPPSLQAVVALVLGFMLVWDMPSIKQGISTLGRYAVS